MLKLRMRLRCYFFPLFSGTLQTLQKLEETSAKLCESEENHSKQKYQLAALQKAVESLRVKKDQLKRDLQNTPWKVCWPVKDYRYHDFPNTEFSYFLTFDARQYELSNYLLKNGVTGRAVGSLTVPSGQEFHFPHFFLKISIDFSLIFPQTQLIFFPILALRVGDSPTQRGPGYDTGHRPLKGRYDVICNDVIFH